MEERKWRERVRAVEEELIKLCGRRYAEVEKEAEEEGIGARKLEALNLGLRRLAERLVSHWGEASGRKVRYAGVWFREEEVGKGEVQVELVFRYYGERLWERVWRRAVGAKKREFSFFTTV